MRVEQSLVALSAARTATVTDETHSTMEAWVGQRPQRSNAVRSGAAPSVLVALTSAAIATEERQAAVRRGTAAVAQQALSKAAATTRSSGASSLDSSDPTLADPNLTVLIAMIERLTGRKVHVIRASDIPTDGPSAPEQSEGAGRAVAAAGCRPARAAAGAAGPKAGGSRSISSRSTPRPSRPRSVPRARS
jgi:hypothetical protein